MMDQAIESIEYLPYSESNPATSKLDFGMCGFDIASAFKGAVDDIAKNKQLELDEQVRRIENMLMEGSSDQYRDFVDFRTLASQIRMACNHNHALMQMMQGSERISDFMGNHGVDVGHGHNDGHFSKLGQGNSGEFVDPITRKKAKRKQRHGGWLVSLLTMFTKGS